MKTLVTGHQGFIGSHLMKKLDNAIGYDLKSGDDILDYNKLVSKMKGIDIVIHLAALLDRNTSNQDFAKTNILGTDNVVRAAVKNKVKKFIYASSAGIYDLTNMYATTKFTGEKIIQKEQIEFICLLRLFNVYGPGGKSVINKFLEAGLKKEKAVIYGNGTNKRDYIYIDDVISAFLTAINSHAKGLYIYDIGTGYSIDLNRIAGLIKGLVGTSYENQPAINEAIRSRANILPLEMTSDWQPKTYFVEGIKKLRDYYATVFIK